ncbi:hypothetical protein [Flavobacterium sp.]|uniref:RHS repeat domain-containing protein n=1 Tax=Flavobacterium sp. TaxID=239 RepID=UPI002631BB16|nr:hypothetical protein [Flavobacterium sp.]
MKTYKFIYFLLVIVWVGASGQELALTPSNPSVGGMIQYESNPADLSTGTPDVSIPLYKMPTRSKDIGIAIGINYHPSTVISYDSLSGNCGRGWTLRVGGSISRDRSATLVNDSIANQKGLYYFNFMQYSGKFKVSQTGNIWEADISENRGINMKVQVNASPLTGMISSFWIFDDKGIVYVFTKTDRFTYRDAIYNPMFAPGYTDDFSISQKAAYHLDKIINPDGNTLAEFNYQSYPVSEDGRPGNQQQLKSISVKGHGDILLNHSENGIANQVRYQSIEVKDVHSNVVRRFEFHYSFLSYIGYLSEVVEGDAALNKVLKHSFFYKHNIPYPTNQMIDIDNWGYYNLSDVSAFDYKQRLYDTRVASSAMCMKNVLEKMVLPTGGCVVYQYEPNSYAAIDGKPIDGVFNNVTHVYDEIPDYFTTLNTNNIHNFDFTAAGGVDFHGTESAIGYTVANGNGMYFFKLYAQPDEGQLSGTPMLYYRLGQVGTPTREFGGKHNAENGSKGPGFTLTNGVDYQISISSNFDAAPKGSVTIFKMNPVNNPFKEHRGNGIRIKKIGYFDNGNVRQDYFDVISSDIPSRVISYTYNFHDRPNRSSGSISDLKTIREYDRRNPKAYNTPSKLNQPVRYKNVTVTDSNNPGKVVYEFTSPIDKPRNGEDFMRYSFGKTNSVIVYNAVGDTIKRTDYAYTNHQTFSVEPHTELDGTGYTEGWSEVKTLKEKMFYSGGSSVQEQHDYEYGFNRRVAVDTKKTSSTNDSLVTKYFYHIDAPLMNNRIGNIDRVETYRNAELLTTSKINYSKNWAAIDEDDIFGLPNPAVLPASDSISKGDQAGRIRIRYNKYDAYSHPLEVQQENGLKTVLLWGYDHTQIVAKLENIDYNSVPKTLIDAIRTASDTGTESDLIDAFNSLRASSAVAAARITTYTYIPLVGLSKVTDINNFTTSYQYDTLGRLISVKDNDGKLLSENDYHYKTQN